jgi:biotin synthase
MRRCNADLQRYRMTAEEILAVAAEIKQARISTVFLQAGQDRQCDAIIEAVIPEIHRRLGLDVLLCVGERPPAIYHRYAALGAGAFILKFETSDPQFYRELTQVPAEHRLRSIRAVRAVGMRLGTGNIVGLPQQTIESIAADFLFARELQPDFVSAAPFIANEGTPLAAAPPGDLDLTLNLMALWRIVLPRSLIPAVSALEKIRPGGQARGLQAGANVLTINFTPEIYRCKYAIYSQRRFIVGLVHALRTIRGAGLQVRGEVSCCSPLGPVPAETASAQSAAG